MDPAANQLVATPPARTAPRMIEVIVKFVMAGKPESTVRVPANCTVRGLKAVIAESSEIFPDKQLLLYNDNEMRDDDAPISHYGITSNCTVTMAVNMNTGVTKQGTVPNSVIFYVPVNFPQDSSGLRSAIKSMTTVKGPKKIKRHKVKQAEKADDAQIWTPEKQLEVELTRNRMKALMRKKNKTKLLFSSSATPIDGGSVINSVVHSPTRTPTSEGPLPSPAGSNEQQKVEEDAEMTDKEMRLFFEPMETPNQLAHFQRQKTMIPPPQSHEELEELKKRLSTVERTTCKLCGKKVPPAEQAIRCRCQRLYCRKHRDPKSHRCRIDYKQTGRKKIGEAMPKVGEGGARKGK